MRTLAHLSDLHFGRVAPGAPEALLDALRALSPDAIVISGDLTQRATRAQFGAAAAFLARLPVAPLCVPGNHDVPLYDLVSRLFAPLAAYTRWVGAPLDTFRDDGEIAIAALNTAHGLTTMHGRLTRAQRRWLGARFAASRARTRIVVSHHPLDLPAGEPHPVPWLAAHALGEWIDRLRVDLFLAGHLHRSRTFVGPLRAAAARCALFVQAGTAVSDRHREDVANSFNLLSLDGDTVRVACWTRRTAGAFAPDSERRFERGPGGWRATV